MVRFVMTYYPAFRKQAFAEAAAAGAGRFRELADNMALADADAGSFLDFAGLLACLPPVFIRHVMPVYETGALTGRVDADLPALLGAAVACGGVADGEKFAVQCRMVGGVAEVGAEGRYQSKDVEVFVGRHFDEIGAVPSFYDYDVTDNVVTAISILIIGRSFYVGVCSTAETLSAHPDEYRALSRGGRRVSRAEHKLKEAITKYKLQLPGGFALDMGASPGGWTGVLAGMGYHVVAVDPGELRQSVLEMPNVTHIRRRVQDVTFKEPFDLIVNDMNISPMETAAVMNGLAPLLKAGGCAVVTLKLPFADASASVRQAAEALCAAYDVADIRNLTHNRAEVTALLYRV